MYIPTRQGNGFSLMCQLIATYIDYGTAVNYGLCMTVFALSTMRLP